MVLSPYQERLQVVKSKIANACCQAGRKASEITLVAVSKTKGIDAIKGYAELEQVDFGENYVQEALAKRQEIDPQFPHLRWHFIGKLQSNKAKQVAGKFSLIHTLDSLSLAHKLNAAALAGGSKQDCLLEINIDAEDSKAGILPEALHELLSQLAPLDGLNVEGFMCIPSHESTHRDPRTAFARMRVLLEAANKRADYPRPLHKLSMGMSHDFEAAILEGATLVRVGTALFGPRENK